MAAAAAAAAATTVLSMKLLIDTKAQRVLFAEAGKDVIDFLFSLLALRVSTAVKLVGKDSMVGSVGNLYASVELDDTYDLQLQGADKAALLRPSPAASSNSSLLGLPEPSSGKPKNLYRCTNTCTKPYSSNCRNYVTDEYGKTCPQCLSSMATAVVRLSSSGADGSVKPAGSAGKGGFVQGIMTYTVMDNLTVTPMSAISSITLLSTLAVTDIGALQEKTVQVGYNEGLEILKASLRSKTVLTDVFLGNKKPCVVDVD